MSNIVRSITARASSPSHKRFNEYVLVHSHVKYDIDIEVILQHLRLVQSAGNSIEDECLLVFVVSLSCLKNDVNYRLIVDEMTLVNLCLDFLLPRVHALWLGRSDGAEVVAS